MHAKSAQILATAINNAFYNASGGGFWVDVRQTHLVMPLATGVASALGGEAVDKAIKNLEHSIRVGVWGAPPGHFDTGLTGEWSV